MRSRFRTGNFGVSDNKLFDCKGKMASDKRMHIRLAGLEPCSRVMHNVMILFHIIKEINPLEIADYDTLSPIRGKKPNSPITSLITITYLLAFVIRANTYMLA